MITKKDIRTISLTLKDFAKRSKDIKLDNIPYCSRTTLKIKATKANADIIAEIIDFLGDFDWGSVEDWQAAEFYKYDEIWYHSIDSHLSPYSDEAEKYDFTPFYEVLLDFTER